EGGGGPGAYEGMLWVLGVIALEDNSQVATFPTLNKNLIDSLQLSEEEINSYTKDLTALRMSIEHFGKNLKVESKEDIENVVAEIDRSIDEKFSEKTMSVVQKMRNYNTNLQNK